MKPKITETELNQEFKRLGFINGLAYKIIGRKYNVTAHGIEVKASKMRKKGTLIKIGGRQVKILNIEELKVLFDDNRDKEENLKVAIKNGLTKEEAEANYAKWKDSYMDGTIKPESHVGKLHTTFKKENKPLESNSSSKDKSTLESTIHSSETHVKEPAPKADNKEIINDLETRRKDGKPQVKDIIKPERVFTYKPCINKPSTLKPVTMEGQNSIYMFNKCGVKVNTSSNTLLTPELLQEQKEALELWNLHYKKLC